MKINVVFTLIFTLALTHSFGQVKKSTKGTFALTNATIETVTKGTVSGTLIISEGKITALGSNVTIPSGANVIDCKGMFIYPGMIDGGTQLGIVEVSSISLTDDSDELGELTPQEQEDAEKDAETSSCDSSPSRKIYEAVEFLNNSIVEFRPVNI